MLRSISYAGESAILAVERRLSTDRQRAERIAAEGVAFVSNAFLEAYDREVISTRAHIGDNETRARLLQLRLLSRALYEINYEAEFRPH